MEEAAASAEPLNNLANYVEMGVGAPPDARLAGRLLEDAAARGSVAAPARHPSPLTGLPVAVGPGAVHAQPARARSAITRVYSSTVLAAMLGQP
jgi:TPR repeat protein